MGRKEIMFPSIKPEIKAEVLKKIKEEGLSVIKAGKDYGISTKTIYGWLAKLAEKAPSLVIVNQLKRENEGLYAIVGRLTTELNKLKKGRS